MSEPTSVPGPQPGDLVAGKYQLGRRLGQGGMGAVFAATHVQLREPVALKFLRAHIASNPAMIARFVREARAAVRIKSEHVARVLDVGALESGEPFIVMELLAGLDLHKTSAERGPLPIPEAALYIAQACDAVAEAHLYGIVHRDLKPANLFLTRRADGSPLVKVLDFGISKVVGEEDENLTATTDVLGSPLYMSPEQIRSPKTVDARTDVWALGAILYKLLTGKAAFAAETSSASLAKIVADPPPALRIARPDAPPELEALLLACLEKDLTRRVQSAVELARALGPFLPEGVRVRVGDDNTAPGASYPSSIARPRPRGRRGLVWVAGGVVLTSIVALAAVLTLASRAPKSLASAAPSVEASAEPSPGPSGAVPASAAPVASASAAPAASASAASPPSASASPTATAAATAAAPPPKPPALPRRPFRGSGPSDAFSDRL
jgi:eukaryotic-like serine/threonine-protein kinase